MVVTTKYKMLMPHNIIYNKEDFTGILPLDLSVVRTDSFGQ